MARQSSSARLALAQEIWEDVTPALILRVDTSRVDRGCVATHVVPPYETMQGFIARVLADAGRHVYQPLWQARRETWAAKAAPLPPRRVIEHRDEEQQKMNYYRSPLYRDPDFEPVRLEEEVLLHEREMEQYTLEPMENDGGRPLVATLVNTVTTAALRGGRAYVPWVREYNPEERVSLLPVLAIHRALLGIVCPYSSQRNHSFRIRYAPPLGAMHAIFPLGNCIQETAATNNALGEFAAQITTSMLRLGLGTDSIEISTRTCNNRVFAMYMDRNVPYQRVLEMFPHVAHLDGRFDGIMLTLPEFKKLRLLSFERPVILVGVKTDLAMRIAASRFIPFLHAAIAAEEKARAAKAVAAAAVAEAARQRTHKKRRRRESGVAAATEDQRPRKRVSAMEADE